MKSVYVMLSKRNVLCVHQECVEKFQKNDTITTNLTTLELKDLNFSY